MLAGRVSTGSTPLNTCTKHALAWYSSEDTPKRYSSEVMYSNATCFARSCSSTTWAKSCLCWVLHYCNIAICWQLVVPFLSLLFVDCIAIPLYRGTGDSSARWDAYGNMQCADWRCKLYSWCTSKHICTSWLGTECCTKPPKIFVASCQP